MSAKRDYYEVLGLDKKANDASIKKAYRKLAKKYHPDSNPNDKEAEKKFKEVTDAYNVLSDKEKKKLYDQFGHAGLDPNGPFANGGAYSSSSAHTGTGHNTYAYRSPDGTYQEFHFEGGDMNDIFGDMFGDIFHHTHSGSSTGSRSGFGQNHSSGAYSSAHNSSGGFGNGFHGNFGSGFGGGFSGQNYQQKGEDLHTEIDISFHDAAFGCDKVIHLNDPSTGQTQSLQVHIPAGIDDGKSVRLKGKGHPGIGGGPAGDLFLKVHIQNSTAFTRKGMDVYTTKRVPFTTVALGGETLVSTLDGQVLCKVRPGTQSGSKIRLKGKGIVSMQNPSVHGDLYVTIQIDVPKNLSPEAQKKLKEFEACCNRNSRYQSSKAS